jgi:hypothetical protein
MDSSQSRLLEKFSKEKKIQLTIRQEIAGGSGAFVALVDAKGETDGVFIAKIGLIPTDHDDEEVLHRRAYDLQAFNRKFPELVGSTRSARHYFLLERLAGGSRIGWQPLIESVQLLRDAYGQLGKVLWTPALAAFSETSASGVELVKTWLGHMLDRDRRGKIVENARNSFSEAVLSSRHFLHVSEALPNPVHFALGSPGTDRLRPLIAPIHGDCHGRNVLVRVSADAQVLDIALIDLASFKDRAPFLFDQTYFELSTLLRKLRGLGNARWLQLTKALSFDSDGTRGLEPSERAWADDILSGRASVLNLLYDAYPDRKDDLRLQFSLAQVAAGLTFLNKRLAQDSDTEGITKESHQQAFVWSAVHLNAYLKANRIEIPAADPAIPVVGFDSRIAARQVAEKDWAAVAGFDDAGLNVLVLGPDERGRKDLVDVLKMPWGLVLDFTTTPPQSTDLQVAGRAIRQEWPQKAIPEVGVIERGTIWYFANGRSDLSELRPTSSARDWNRTYARHLRAILDQIEERLAPASVRVLSIGSFDDPMQLRSLCEILDSAFKSLCPLFVAPPPPAGLTYVKVIGLDAASLLTQIAERIGPSPDRTDRVLIPCRVDSQQCLEPIPDDLAAQVERDLTVVHRGRAAFIAPGRVFGVDFRRGMTVEWSELAQGLDVPREKTPSFLKEIREALAEQRTPTVNLRHEPSAGGTTVSRRIAWSLMEEFPVVILDQFTTDTSGYLRDLFRFSSIPILLLAESQTLSETERENLVTRLREDNTRAAILWISRAYRVNDSDVLPARLTPRETDVFLNTYLEQTQDPSRRANLRQLATNDLYLEQRSPFFFGLTAFASDFVGLDRLVGETVENAKQQHALTPLSTLSLVSYYCADGFPQPEFDEFCKHVTGTVPSFLENSPFALRSKHHVKIPHILIAERTLQRLARDPELWRADLHRVATGLLTQVEAFRHRDSDRLSGMIDTLFLVRDLFTALQADVEASRGNIVSPPRRFSPLIRDIGQNVLARELFERLTRLWPDKPHYAVHLARHLLYEDPKDVERAIQIMTRTAESSEGKDDDTVVHTLGQAYRIRMELALKTAADSKQSFDHIEGAVRTDFSRAIDLFSRSTELSPRSEYGEVATIQTAHILLQYGKLLAGAASLPEFLRTKGRWCLEALSIAEEKVQSLNNRPQRDLSVRAQQAVAQWSQVYGNLDAVIEQLRRLSQTHNDASVRRALCFAIVAKHARKWTTIPQGDLRTIENNMLRNIEEQGVRDSDIRNWFRAFRLLRTYDWSNAVTRLADWSQLRPKSVEPAFYLFAIYFVAWLNSDRRNEALADQAREWLNRSQAIRLPGDRGWGFEWLSRSGERYILTNFRDLIFDPVEALRAGGKKNNEALEASLARIEGIVKEYQRPQHAMLDLGQRLSVKFVPFERIRKDDEGKRASMFLAFAYDGAIGYDAKLVK